MKQFFLVTIDGTTAIISEMGRSEMRGKDRKVNLRGVMVTVASSFLQNFAVFLAYPVFLISTIVGQSSYPFSLSNHLVFFLTSAGAFVYSLFWFIKLNEFRNLNALRAASSGSFVKESSGERSAGLIPIAFVSFSAPWL